MRWIAICGVALLAAGCVTNREITISAKPEDAAINIDGTDRGRGPITQKFEFHGSDDAHRVTASRLGYTPQMVDLTSKYDKNDLVLELQPRTRQITLRVTPVPAMVSVDDKPQGDQAVSDLTLTLPFTVDASNQWTQHVIGASRQGYQAAEQVVKWDDTTNQYELKLDFMRKDLAISTDPPGANVSIGGRSVGKSPLEVKAVTFPVDRAGKFIAQTISISKPGYDPLESSISWDNGRRTYELALVPKTKQVRIATDPPNADVKIDGHTLEHDASGAAVARLTFPPTDDQGTLKTYNALVTKKTADTEWVPEELTIAWDNGKQDYSVAMAEVKTRPVTLLRPKIVRTDDGWQIVPETLETLGMKDVTEGPAAEPPVRITELQAGTLVDSLAISPDGQWLLFTVLNSKDKSSFHSQIQMIKTDGSSSPSMFGDGRSLDLTPSFSADGSQIVFASNRGGRHMSIWQMAANGEGGVTQLTAGDTTDLWPSVDSDPRPRLYYEALVDSRPDPRLYMTQLGTTLRTDLTTAGGEQPRVSPKADSVLFTTISPKTGKREICKMSDRGGAAANLTNLPDFESFDPVWSKDGNRVAFVSDRGTDADKHNNFDIWVMDMRHPDKPTRVTTNGSWDDNPVWDPGGRYIYFRSNRGGTWGIWRITLK
jgi:dipeptidyl aminopeptidase/acylaminoacyl peptidase